MAAVDSAWKPSFKLSSVFGCFVQVTAVVMLGLGRLHRPFSLPRVANLHSRHCNLHAFLLPSFAFSFFDLLAS